MHYIGIDVEHLVAHVHAQKDLKKSFIKCLKLIARPLPMKSKLLIFIWGHIILRVASLVKIIPSAYHKYSHLQLVFGIPPNIFYLWTFGYAVYMPITAPHKRPIRVLNVEYKFIMVLILHLLLDFLNLWLIMFLRHILTVILMRTFSHH